jgi:DNA adenine methylase
MRFEVPHPIPYQGSKRQLASAILQFVPKGRFSRLVEPFAGSAAITLATAARNFCERFLIADTLGPLVGIWREIILRPDRLASRYRALWQSQLRSPRKKYDQIREEFNRDPEPAKLLFLLARCVKNSVRFNPAGEFNQSPDNRRLGARPDSMEREIRGAHLLLAGRCETQCSDFRETLRATTPDDVVYMDPPYQGTSNGRDRRYFKGVTREDLIQALEDLNERGIQYLLSYDGKCGTKSYGQPLPPRLGLHRIDVDAGRSSQATLSGRRLRTVESLYLSPGLIEGREVPTRVHYKNAMDGVTLFQ